MSEKVLGEVTDEWEPEPDEGPEPVDLAWRANVPSNTPTQADIAERS